MSTAVFPTFAGLAWSVTKTPDWQTRLSRASTGKTRAVGFQSYPTWRFGLTITVLRDDPAIRSNVGPTSPNGELRDLMGFYNARHGELEPFFLTDPTDFQVTSQQIGTGNGTSTDFPVIRALAGSGQAFTEPVGGINTMSLLTVNGSSVLGTAQMNTPYDGWVRLASPPANGHAVVWSGSFYFRVRFATPRLEFENMMRGLWQVRQLPLEQAKV